MNTTNKYILDEDIYEPLTYQNDRFSKVCQIVKNLKKNRSVRKILYINLSGRIEQIQWVSPAEKPKHQTITQIDYIAYNSENKIKSITTRLTEPADQELGNIQYLYDSKKLVKKIESHSIQKNCSPTITTYDYKNSNLVKLQKTAKTKNDEKTEVSIKYLWNKENQIVQKNRISIVKQVGLKKEVTTTTTNYTYRNKNQLKVANTQVKKNNKSTNESSTFKYVDSTSNQISRIETFINNKLSHTIQFSMNNNRDILTQRIFYQDQESLIKFIGYE